MLASTDRLPGYIVGGNGDAGNARVVQRGASIACCTFTAKSTMLINVLHRPLDLIVPARAPISS
jgi:hypothetical protein